MRDPTGIENICSSWAEWSELLTSSHVCVVEPKLWQAKVRLDRAVKAQNPAKEILIVDGRLLIRVGYVTRCSRGAPLLPHSGHNIEGEDKSAKTIDDRQWRIQTLRLRRFHSY